MKKRFILLIEPVEEHIELIERSFMEFKDEMQLEVCNKPSQVDTFLNQQQPFDLIICNLELDEDFGRYLLNHSSVKQKTPVIFLSSQGSEVLAVSLIKEGALDYLIKTPRQIQNLPATAYKAMREWENFLARYRAEKKLKESEKKFKQVTENINDVIFEMDSGLSGFTFVSDSIVRFLGYSKEEFLATPVYDIIHEDAKPEIEKARSHIIQCLKEGKDPKSFHVDLEIKFTHKDRSIRWGQVRGFMGTNSQNQIVAISGITRDITRQKEADKELKVQEAYFETLVKEAPLAIVILDNQDRVKQANNQFLELFEYSFEECLDQPVNNLIVPEHLKDEGKHLTTQAASGRQITNETVRQTRSGRLINVLILGKPVMLNQSKLGVLGIYQDISQQKSYENRLRKLSERLLLATQAAAIGIWDYNLESKELYWEKEMFNLHELDNPGTQDLQTLWESVTLNDDLPKLKPIFNQEYYFKDNFDLTYRIYDKKRKIKNIRLFASVHFDENKKPLRIVGCCWDITQEVENTELNKKIEVSAKVANIKQQFLANMSHEIRSPMTGILGMIDLIKKTKMDEQQLFFLDVIKKSSDGLLHIVNDILDLSKIEAGKMIIRPRVYNLKKSAHTIHSLFGALAGQKELDLLLEYDQSLPELVYADENRISQIITNLISNAIKFTREGWVKLKFSKHEESDDSVGIKVSVQDTGIGIGKEDTRKLFKMFSQLDNSDTRSFDGTGLGLSISERLAELMNARINVQSEPGKGSTFSLTFKSPKVRGEHFVNEEEQKETETDQEKLGYKVLLTEDKRTNQMVLSLLFREVGCTVEIANNGQETLEMFKPGKYDFIFMDIQMPVMDGLTAVRKLRENYSPRQLPFIVGLSAKAMEGDAEFYMSKGMHDYLTKPVTSGDIRACIKKLTREKSPGNNGSQPGDTKNYITGN